MRIFVITLNRYDCRWAKYNKNYELFMGVDVYKIKEDNEYFKKIRNRYNIKHKQKQNIVGCFLSHLKVMEYIVENKLNEILIIEDDAVIDEIISIFGQELKGIDDIIRNQVGSY